MLAQPAVHVPEIGMHMVGVPIERVVFRAQVVAREVAARVPQAVELVPEQPARPDRHGDHAGPAGY